MIDESSALSLAIGFGSIGLGMVSLASANIYRTMKSPKEANAELAVEVSKLRTELAEERNERAKMATSNAVLATEVKHLGENVGLLAVEVKALRDKQWGTVLPPKRR